MQANLGWMIKIHHATGSASDLIGHTWVHVGASFSLIVGKEPVWARSGFGEAYSSSIGRRIGPQFCTPGPQQRRGRLEIGPPRMYPVIDEGPRLG
jgi:hypothetical protein